MKAPLLTSIGVMAIFAGCSSNGSERTESREYKSETRTTETTQPARKDTGDTLSYFESNVSGLHSLIQSSAGYAVFPDVGKGGVIVGGASGTGDVYAGGARIGTAELTMGTVGAQLGGQSFQELVVFKDQAALDRFKAGEFNFAANATAVAIKPGAAATNDWHDGVQVYIHVKGGLMAEASVGGQRLKFTPTR